MIPCNCCPLGLTRCSFTYTDCTPAPVLLAQSTTSPVPNQTLVTANPNGIGTINLAATADGNTAGGSYGGFNSNAGNATNVIMEYRWNVAVDRAVQIRLWNNGGGNLNDGDGGPGQGGNGGASANISLINYALGLAGQATPFRGGDGPSQNNRQGQAGDPGCGGSGADSGNAFGTNGGAGGHGFVLIAW